MAPRVKWKRWPSGRGGRVGPLTRWCSGTSALQKATEANLRFQAALVDHVSDAIISTTTSGYVTSWNPAAEAMYQRPAVDALGLPIGEVVGTHLDLAGSWPAGGGTHHPPGR